MKFKFNKAKWLIDSEGVWLNIQAPDSLKDEIQDFISRHKDNPKEYTAEIKQHREKRSLDSNAYCWVLINEMANVLRTSKEEVYLMMLKRYGQVTVVSVLADAVEAFQRAVKYSEVYAESTMNGKLFKHVKVYAGSSTYSTREMAILIDGIISECKELGISTLTPDEIERMKGAWGVG